MTLERGTHLHKRYRIVEILGQGGMGSVYRAVDENLGVEVAVKENLFTTDEYSRQFRLEAVILANLRHPNMPRVSDHFSIGEEGQYLVMDFIEGEDLRQRMERDGTILEDDAVQIGAAICDALLYLHTRKPPILHRDIKPGNVKITPDGHIFLVDFGLAKVVQGAQVTTTGARAMTPGYSPPEQYGTARTDPRTDIYSLGATLYAALCGVIPEDGLARAMDNAELTPLRKRNPKISRRLAAAIEKAMAVDPADRFQTADEFKKALLGSKSKTLQLTGNYTVTPPPPDANEPEKEYPTPTAVESDSSKPPKPVSPPGQLLAVEDEKPFIPPGKKKKEQKKRRQRGVIVFLLILILGLAGWLYLNPYLLPLSLRAQMPYLPATATFTFTPTALPTTTASPEPTFTLTQTAIPPTPTFTLTVTPRPLFTETPLPGVTAEPTQIPSSTATPQGGGYGQIAFVSDRTGIPQIYLLDVQSGVSAPITKMSEGACQPSWSPDGVRLVFVSPCKGPNVIVQNSPGDTSLYTINADGSDVQQITSVPLGNSEPAWAPDGEHIAFTSIRDGSMQIYTISLIDQSVTRLTDLGVGVDARQPSWSALGNQITFAARRFGAYQIWTMLDNGENAQQIIRSGPAFLDYMPVWSKDDTVIIYSQQRADETSPPWQMSVLYEKRGGTSATRLELGPLPVEHLVFSNDGFWMVFQGREVNGSTLDLYLISTGESERIRLTTDPGNDFDPAWRPVVTH
jgi:serine/threonine protein kinase/Tol biopolymer transport system component